MQLTDFSFLFAFLPLSYLVYLLLVRQKIKTSTLNVYLLVISLLFYAAQGFSSLFILVFILLWNWFCAGAIEYDLTQRANPSLADRSALDPAENMEAPNLGSQTGAINPAGSIRAAKSAAGFHALPAARQTLWLCVGVNLLILLLYKYLPTWLAPFGFASRWISQFVMPIGLSFYMFSSLSYVFDVYNQKAKTCSLVNFGLFTAFFGRVIMGPIGHYAQFKDQLDDHPVTRRAKRYGAVLFLQGMFYKVMLADNLALIFAGLETNTSWLGTWLLAVSYTLQLYFDFMGYSRMARGLASLFGFQIPQNFDKPYTALSIQEFWRRWHISLTDWFREYIYIPLGGNRVSQSRWVLNLFVVWLLTGIWHGPTLPFFVWGILQGGLILAEHKLYGNALNKAPAWTRHLYVMVLVMISWTIFFSPTIGMALARIGRMFFVGIEGFSNSQAMFYLVHGLILLAAAIFCATNLPKKATHWITVHVPLNKGLLGAFGYGLGLVICLAMLISQTSQAFLYTAF